MHTVRTVSLHRQQSLDQLLGESFDLASSWHRCSDNNPFRDYPWLHSWWQHLPPNDAQALVLLVSDPSDQVIGILPLYRTSAASRTWRSWGDGNTCSDHQSPICQEEHRSTVADLLTKELIRISNDPAMGWNQLLLDGVLAGDVAMGEFARAFQRYGASMDCHSRMNLWFKQGCENWEIFLQQQSKRLRSKLRQLLRTFDEDENWSLIRHDKNSPVLHEALDQLIELHQKRWNAVGQPGTYSDSQTRTFLHKFVESLCERGQVYLPVLTYQQSAVAAELHLIGSDGRFHCYTSGVDMNQPNLTPGLMLNALTLRFLHQTNAPGIDFMRGDEEYKSRLGADSVPLLNLRITPPHWRGQVSRYRHNLEMKVRQWARKRFNRPLARIFSPQEAFSPIYSASPCHSLPAQDSVTCELSCVGS